ncbi:hypothetical protein [Peterkaempfera bronchialis]|uniref:hypothetical protein n=1 Tax=Peterkaempfera bronchialis TaxID=2126346 RepID=UPI0013B35799|nr:hypothetical protein [Peterkaempfera bronchialis]
MPGNGDATNQVTATVDAVSEALLSGRGWLHPAASLTTPTGRTPLFSPAITTDERHILPGTGAVIGWTSTAQPPAPVGAAAVRRILERLGPGPEPTADALHLPVTAEPAPADPRPAFPRSPPHRPPRPAPDPGHPGVRVRLAIPAVFHPLLVPGDADALAAHLIETAEEVLAGAPGTARRDWATVTAATTDAARAAGTFFAGLCRLDLAGRESTASLVAAVIPAAEPPTEAREVELPCGPATVLVEARTTPVPAQLSTDGRRRLIGTAAALALIPLPDTQVLALQLSTPHEQDWELYAAAFAGILHSIEIAWPGPPPPPKTPNPPRAPRPHPPADWDPWGGTPTTPEPPNPPRARAPPSTSPRRLGPLELTPPSRRRQTTSSGARAPDPRASPAHPPQPRTHRPSPTGGGWRTGRGGGSRAPRRMPPVPPKRGTSAGGHRRAPDARDPPPRTGRHPHQPTQPQPQPRTTTRNKPRLTPAAAPAHPTQPPPSPPPHTPPPRPTPAAPEPCSRRTG